MIYVKKGTNDKALEFLNKSLNIRLQSLPEYHPYFAVTNNNICMIYVLKRNK